MNLSRVVSIEEISNTVLVCARKVFLPLLVVTGKLASVSSSRAPGPASAVAAWEGRECPVAERSEICDLEIL